MNDQPPPWSSEAWIAWTTRLLNSYRKFVGKDLIPRTSAEQDSQTLYDAPFVVVAHGTEDDPLLSYGNQAALDLWHMSLDELIGTPSRKTAEPVHRDERAELLRRTREHGYIDDYTGIRIASTGKRFRIHQATVWNVVSENDAYVGQAAAFADWTMLTE